MQIITEILKNSDYWSIITLGRHPILWIQRVGHGEPSARLSCLNTFLWYLLHRQVPSFQFAVSRGKMNKAILNWNLHEENVAIWRTKFIYSFFKCCSIKYKHMVILTNKLQIELSYRRTIRFNETMRLNIIKKSNI